jgi:hypothetical protein
MTLRMQHSGFFFENLPSVCPVSGSSIDYITSGKEKSLVFGYKCDHLLHAVYVDFYAEIFNKLLSH